MVEDGEYIAVLDRFEEDLAVLVLEREGEDLDELVVDRNELPEPGRHPDSVFRVIVEGEELVECYYRKEETEERKEDVQDRFNRLSQRPPKEDEDK